MNIFKTFILNFFCLKPDEFSLYWKGLGGLKAKDLFQFNDMTRDIQPPILFLEVGTKDLCDPIMLHDDIALLVKNFWSISTHSWVHLNHKGLKNIGHSIKRA